MDGEFHRLPGGFAIVADRYLRNAKIVVKTREAVVLFCSRWREGLEREREKKKKGFSFVHKTDFYRDK